MADVRVRLSAEGVSDVIAAFKKISDEGQKTKNSAASIDKALSSIGTTLAALSVGAAIAGLARLVDRSIDTVQAQGKMAKTIGISVQQLQVFDFAARKAHVGVEQMNTGLQKGSKFFFELQTGTQAAKDTITALFGNPDALKGLTDQQKLQAVIDKLAQMPASFNKAALAQRIFGRAGSELIPVLDSLSSDKLKAVTAEATRLGQVLSQEDVAAIQAANDALDELKAVATGVQTQFTAGFVPAITKVALAFSNIITSSDGGVKQLGEDVGVFLTAFSIGVLNIFDFFDEAVSGLVAMLLGAGTLMQTGSVKAAKIAFGNVIDQQIAAEKLRAKALREALTPRATASPANTIPGGGDLDLDQQRRATKDALAFELASLENARKIRLAALSQQEVQSQNAYSQGLISLSRYYEDRQNIILNQTQAEIDAAQNAIKELTKTPLRPEETKASRQKQIDDEKAKSQIAEIDREKQLTKLATDRGNDERALAEKLLEFEGKLGQLQGDRHAQEIAALQKETDQFERLLKQQGAPNVAERVKQFLDVGQAKIQFDDLRTSADAALNEIAAKQQQLQGQVANGTLFQSQANQQLIQFEKSRLGLLQEITAEAEKEAVASGDPERIQSARQLTQQVNGLAVSTDLAAQRMAQLKQGVEGAVGQSIQDFLSRGILQADSLGDAFRGLAASIVSSMQQVLASIIAAYIQQKLFGELIKSQQGGGGGGGGLLSGFLGFLGGLGGGGGGGAAAGGGGGGGAATGGLITGPGTGTSDSIPIRASNMEYVVKASAVKQPGVLSFLDAVNRMGNRVFQSPRGYFASGGLVTGQSLTTTPANLTGPSEGILHLILDPAIVLKHFEGRGDFSRLIVKTVGDHRKAMNGALGK